MFLQKFEMDQDGVYIIVNPMKDLAKHLKQINPICSVANCPNIYNKIETHGNCGVALCKSHIKDGTENKEKIWKLFVAGEDKGDYTNVQIMSFMHKIVYKSRDRVIEFALIDNSDKILKDYGDNKKDFNICEICGKAIISPNYAKNYFEGMYEEFYECARCEIEFSIDRYMEFKDDFPNSSEFHTFQLAKINALNKTFLSFK